MWLWWLVIRRGPDFAVITILRDAEFGGWVMERRLILRKPE